MTSPRINPDRELFGLLGSLENTSSVMQWWNAEFLQKGVDATLSRYPTEIETLPERLSEMFHFDRRGYIVGKGLTKAIIPLLDHLDSTALEEGSVDTVWNIGGVLTGHFCGSQNRDIQWSLLTSLL